jgi:hypothetical protein
MKPSSNWPGSGSRSAARLFALGAAGGRRSRVLSARDSGRRCRAVSVASEVAPTSDVALTSAANLLVCDALPAAWRGLRAGDVGSAGCGIRHAYRAA